MRHTIGCPDAVKNLGGCLISSWTEDSENEVIYMVLVNLPYGYMNKIMNVFAFYLFSCSFIALWWSNLLLLLVL